ncbi:DNA polymerase I B, mitochondrial-like [Papaver somniferum]|uniref:DNA polymerase I B, mitochondrial-like n=1 Tax=Papaver somniferum TaxID=3469 RepID=UPI000E6FC8C4|nr:DNA polymerase I B, mitochondrial-like [Papaver somniferum]
MIAEREPYTHFGKIFFEHPNFVVSEGRLVSRRSGSLVNEEKEGAHRCFDGQSEMKFGDIPFCRSSDYGDSTCIFTGAAESKKLRVVKVINFGLDSAAKDEGVQSSFGRTYLGDDIGTQKASISLLATSDNGSSGGVSTADEATYTRPIKNGDKAISTAELRESLSRIYDEVLVCKIDVKKDTPVDHGEVTCFCIYSGEGADFGKGKSCIWVDVLDGGGRDIMIEFSPFFEDPSIKKVWHNYSFDSHVIDNYGLKNSGFHADTMHLARLWDSSRGSEDGYSLESLTSDPRVMNENSKICGSRKKKVGIISGINQGKISFKIIFGKGKLKKDGSEGKVIVTSPVEKLQRKERMLWICYSSLGSISTLKLFESLKKKLQAMEWILDGRAKGNMYNFYEEFWRPYGELLVKMETEGMLVNREALADMEKLAIVHQQVAIDKFRQWASKMCPGVLHMNVGSDSQLRHLFFGGMRNSKDDTQTLEEEKEYKVLKL